jgi:hypothetical protein
VRWRTDQHRFSHYIYSGKGKEIVMFDDRESSDPEDRARINTNEAWQIAYWTRVLGLTEERLIALVKEVGPVVANVKKKLGG